MRNIYFIFLFILIAGCNNQNKNNGLSEGSKEPTFEGFLSEVYSDELPFMFDCSKQDSQFDISYAVYHDYTRDDGYPFLQFQTDSIYTLILYTNCGEKGLPFLYSYDGEGRIIDSIALFIGECRDDFYSQSKDYAVINEDYSIELTDSLKNYTVTGNTRTLNSSTVEYRRYILNEFGKFEIAEIGTVQLLKEN